MKALFKRALFFALVWWALTEGRADGWLFGLLAIVAATGASTLLPPPSPRPVRLLKLPAFLGYFLVNSLLGGWQVALMALRGRAALQPAVLDLPLDLPAGAAQTLLTNLLCLMPGTVGVAMVDARLRVHVLDRRLPVADKVKEMERRVAALFGARA